MITIIKMGSDCVFITTLTDVYIERVKCPLCKIDIAPQLIKQSPDVPKPTGPLNQ